MPPASLTPQVSLGGSLTSSHLPLSPLSILATGFLWISSSLWRWGGWFGGSGTLEVEEGDYQIETSTCSPACFCAWAEAGKHHFILPGLKHCTPAHAHAPQAPSRNTPHARAHRYRCRTVGVLYAATGRTTRPPSTYSPHLPLATVLWHPSTPCLLHTVTAVLSGC